MQLKAVGLFLVVTSMLGAFVGCAGETAGAPDSLLAERDDGTPVDRVDVSGELQSFPAGSEEAIALMSLPDEPAADGELGASAQALMEEDVADIELEGEGRSCSARDKSTDCYCTGGCCRNQTSCWCC